MNSLINGIGNYCDVKFVKIRLNDVQDAHKEYIQTILGNAEVSFEQNDEWINELDKKYENTERKIKYIKTIQENEKSCNKLKKGWKESCAGKIRRRAIKKQQTCF